MNASVTWNGNKLAATINLPASKSISNRALIICAAAELNPDIGNCSTAEDTVRLQTLLTAGLPEVIEAGEGGTTSRFLTALAALKPGKRTVRVSGTMQSRPVGPLVDAIRSLGRMVNYLGREGFFPIEIAEGAISKSQVTADGTVSSQFISALMMIGPCLPEGLFIAKEGDWVSEPYLGLTKSVMEHYGARVVFDASGIRIEPTGYRQVSFTVEPDWSAASYWYEAAALSAGSRLVLKNLSAGSMQGDRVVAEYMKAFGVTTEFEPGQAIVRHDASLRVADYFSADFSGCPDVAPALIAAAAASGITADFPGLVNFRLKESDRASALQRELYRFNIKTDFCGGSKFKVYPGEMRGHHMPVSTYGDHRVAMALAMLALRTGTVVLENAGVVSKSYPGFFDDLRTAGFGVAFSS